MLSNSLNIEDNFPTPPSPPLKSPARLRNLLKLVLSGYQLFMSLRSSLLVLSFAELRSYPSCIYGEVWPPHFDPIYVFQTHCDPLRVKQDLDVNTERLTNAGLGTVICVGIVQRRDLMLTGSCQ